MKFSVENYEFPCHNNNVDLHELISKLILLNIINLNINTM